MTDRPETTFCPIVQATTNEQWFIDATDLLRQAILILLTNGVPAGAQISVQGGTLHVR